MKAFSINAVSWWLAAGTPPPPLHGQFAPGEISANIRVLFVSYPVLYMYCQSSIFCHRMWCTCHMYSDRCTTGCTAPPLIGEQQHCFHVIFGLAGPLHTISTVAIQPPPKLEFSMTSDTKLTLAEFSFFFNRRDTIQYFGGLRSRELGQAPILLVFLFS